MDAVSKLIVYNKRGDLCVIWKPKSTEFSVHRVYGSSVMSGQADTFTRYVRGGAPDIWEAAQFAADWFEDLAQSREA